MSFHIENKVVMVAGAAGDIGRAIVSAFLSEGCYVAATGTDVERCKKALYPLPEGVSEDRLICVPMNIKDSETIKSALDRIYDTFHHVDVLVNSAGILCRKSLLDTEKEDMAESFHVNTIGAYDLCRQTAMRMKERQCGTIINIGSQNGLTAIENRVAYSASKAALTMMTKTMALELAPYNITVNMVAPGIVDSAMALERLNTPEIRAKYEEAIPLGRLVSPEDCAGSTLFMASPYASCITGTVLLVDGGLLLRQSLPR